jgi:ATP synthase protein I
MSEHPEWGSQESRDRLARRVAAEEARKLRARRRRAHSIWFGLGTFGMVGWSIAIPTLLAIALGVWIDTTWPSRFSWTLMLLFVGIVVGCLNAWYWVEREREIIEREDEDLKHE